MGLTILLQIGTMFDFMGCNKTTNHINFNYERY